MKQYVELADGPRGGVVDLTAEAEICGVAAGLLDELAANDEHSARAAGRIIDAHAGRRLEDADHEANDVAWGVEIPALLAGRLGKHEDQKFVRRAEEVGKLEILVAQAVATEMAHEILAGII